MFMQKEKENLPELYNPLLLFNAKRNNKQKSQEELDLEKEILSLTGNSLGLL